QAILKALASKGVLRTLARPTVVAASGETASFLSGGEIPVPIASAGTSGGTTVTIEWKEFGVKVEFLPTIVDEGVINLKVSPEASSLDFNNGVLISGFQIPAIRTRKAETTVELRHNETLVIGGLILEEESDFETKTPILGDIPILGYFFRGIQKASTTSELLIVVSPRIIRANPPGTRVPLPTDLPSDTEDAPRSGASGQGGG
ncbi:MAG: type II and III secretion system protein family protein, partial [bacterium]